MISNVCKIIYNTRGPKINVAGKVFLFLSITCLDLLSKAFAFNLDDYMLLVHDGRAQWPWGPYLKHLAACGFSGGRYQGVFTAEIGVRILHAGMSLVLVDSCPRIWKNAKVTELNHSQKITCLCTKIYLLDFYVFRTLFCKGFPMYTSPRKKGG